MTRSLGRPLAGFWFWPRRFPPRLGGGLTGTPSAPVDPASARHGLYQPIWLAQEPIGPWPSLATTGVIRPVSTQRFCHDRRLHRSAGKPGVCRCGVCRSTGMVCRPVGGSRGGSGWTRTSDSPPSAPRRGGRFFRPTALGLRRADRLTRRPAPTTTAARPPAIATSPPSATSSTDSSASSTTACTPASSTTRQPHSRAPARHPPIRLDVMKERGLRSSWVPGACSGCSLCYDEGGPCERFMRVGSLSVSICIDAVGVGADERDRRTSGDGTDSQRP